MTAGGSKDRCGPPPENITEGTNSPELCITHFSGCIFERTHGRDTQVWGLVGLSSGENNEECQTLGKIWCTWGKHVVNGNVPGSSRCSTHTSAEAPRVTHTDLFVDNDPETKRPNRGGSKIKCGMKKYQANLVGSSVAWRKELRVILVWGRRWSHKYFGKLGTITTRIDKM